MYLMLVGLNTQIALRFNEGGLSSMGKWWPLTSSGGHRPCVSGSGMSSLGDAATPVPVCCPQPLAHKLHVG